MKSYCKRSLFIPNGLSWRRGEYYEHSLSDGYESFNGVYIFIKNKDMSIPFAKSVYEKHFKSIEDIRDEKIEILIK